MSYFLVCVRLLAADIDLMHAGPCQVDQAQSLEQISLTCGVGIVICLTGLTGGRVLPLYLFAG
jgi:hypothetical protein